MRFVNERRKMASLFKFGAPAFCLAAMLAIPHVGFAQSATSPPQEATVAPPPTPPPAPAPAAMSAPATAPATEPTAAPASPPVTATAPAEPSDAATAPQPAAPAAAEPNTAPTPLDTQAQGGPSLIPARLLPHDLSPWGMFVAADIVVKVVIVGLAIASLATWTVWLAKSIELFTAKRRAQNQLGILARASTLSAAAADLGESKGAVVRMVVAASAEVDRSADLYPDGIKERAAALIARIEARAGRVMNRGTGILATIGATAPFVGLFGTVWGIMYSFIGISKTNTTNLAVVAPGIAQALLATAFGLVAAIPAVIIYNMFARSIAAYRATLGDAAAEILRHVSRDLDRGTPAAKDEDWHVVGMRRSAE
jgi:biopolymer transport protein ExbB